MPDPKVWNPWHGCRKYSEGCENCYMYYLDGIRGVSESSTNIHKTADFDKPLKKNRFGDYNIPAGTLLRVNMTSDTFIEEADEWRESMWSIIRQRSDLIFWILTKRVNRIKDNLPRDWGDGYENISLNITTENQRTFDERWGIFKDIPARHKGILLAPMLSAIDIEPALRSGQIEVVGLSGEGTGGRRICHHEWVQRISELCNEYRTTFVFYTTGTEYQIGNKTYMIEDKKTERQQAFYSELSCYYNLPKFNLKAPQPSLLPIEDMIPKPTFAVNRCIYCTHMPICTGCIKCSYCKNSEFVNRKTMLLKQQKALKEHIKYKNKYN